ncbi:pyruvate dehydrogenase (acetyl-transferring) E1 component subunit alpha, partial [Streptomyces sp. 2MCAF27]
LLEEAMRDRGLLDDQAVQAARDAAELMAADLRTRMHQDPALDPMDLFEDVYAEKTGQLREQADALRAELAAEEGER